MWIIAGPQIAVWNTPKNLQQMVNSEDVFFTLQVSSQLSSPDRSNNDQLSWILEPIGHSHSPNLNLNLKRNLILKIDTQIRRPAGIGEFPVICICCLLNCRSRGLDPTQKHLQHLVKVCNPGILA